MQLILDPPTLDRVRPSAVTIGVFDGVHLGHRHLISHAVRRAQLLGIRSVAITFDPHPRAVLAKGEPVQYLSDLAERSRLIHEIGVDVVATLKFTPVVAALTAEAFMEEVKARLGLIELWVGPDFALGRGRQGTVPVLREIGARMGFTVNTVEPRVVEGVVVSSSIIRQMLAQGDVEAAALLLGRPYALEGVVRHGDHRGRLLGFPTANLDLDPSRVAPEDGVYVAAARLPNGRLPAVANIGVRPSFGPGSRGLEVHVLDYSGDLYGQRICVEFLHRLRPEVRFASIVDLQAQIRRDAEAAREYLRKGRSV